MGNISRKQLNGKKTESFKISQKVDIPLKWYKLLPNNTKDYLTHEIRKIVQNNTPTFDLNKIPLKDFKPFRSYSFFNHGKEILRQCHEMGEAIIK